MSALLLQRIDMQLPRFLPLADALTDPTYGPSFEPNRSPFAYGIREEEGMEGKTFFGFLKANPAIAQRFNSTLGLTHVVTEGEIVLRDYPWHALPSGSTIVDVGSGIGTVGLGIARAHPRLKVTLQDQGHVMVQAEETWRTDPKYASGRESGAEVAFVPIDFFAEAPVKGQDVYFIRQCMHNWSDDGCVTILKNIRSAMKPTSRVLIHEYILQSNAPSSSTGAGDATEPAPHPLLPSYGYGGIGAYHHDVTMLILLNAQERTLAEFQAIGARAGLRFVKNWQFLETGLIEFEVDETTTVADLAA